MTPLDVSVPGKLLLLGEYAVLEQGRAVSAAVNRRATGRRTPKGAPESPVVEAVRQRIERELGVLDFGVEIDTRAFRSEDGIKLGIGSSSAAAVAAAGLFAGRSDAEVCRWAVEGHREAAAGRGSGVDVVTCFAGGIVSAERQPGLHERLSEAWPGYELHVVFLGEAASTPDMVRRCRAAPDWLEHTTALKALCDEGVAALRAEDPKTFIDVVRRYADGLDALGQSAGAPVVTETMRIIQTRADALGGAAKGSGAGGGDVMVLWLPTGVAMPELPPEAWRVELAVDPAGMTLSD